MITSATSTPSSASASAAKGKLPLRSSMRSTNRSSSPMTAISASPSNVRHGEGKVLLSNGLAVGAHETQLQQQERMSKQERRVSARREDSKRSGGDSDRDRDSVSTVFYSDQGKSGAARVRGR